MPDNALFRSLGILRLIKSVGVGSTGADILRNISGEDITSAKAIRVLLYFHETLTEAKSLIDSSPWSEETKIGLKTTLDGLSTAFSPPQIANTAVLSYVPAIDSSLLNFAMISELTGSAATPPPQELQDLIRDVQQMEAAFAQSSLDPVIKEVAARHLNALRLMLDHLSIFGVDAALANYAELVVRLKRAGTATTEEEGRSFLAKVWPELERWAGRLAIIDAAVTQGQHLLVQASPLLGLLPHFTK